VIGGNFATVNGSSQPGSARVSASTGAVQSWAVNKVVQNNGPDSAIWSMSSDSTYVYATGYSYKATTAGRKLEGAYVAAWNGGTIHWIEDCHGDTYAATQLGSVVYTASHAHYCRNVVGGFNQVSNPDGTPAHFQRGMGFSGAVAGTLKTESSGYSNFGGQPSPAVLVWFPDFNTGTYTGQNQGPWNVAHTSQYVVYAGEFTQVNGRPQQGLVRFAIPSIAPNHDGPRLSGSGFVPTVAVPGGGKAVVSWIADYDRDNEYLTYTLHMDGNTVATYTVGSRIWYARPGTTWTKTGLAVGSTHRWYVVAKDPYGNTATSATVSATIK